MQILSDGNIALGLVYYHLGYFFKRLLTEKKDFPDIKILVLTIVIFVLILFLIGKIYHSFCYINGREVFCSICHTHYVLVIFFGI